MKTLLSLSIVLSLLSVPVLAQPTDNPLSSYALEWTSTIPWDNTIAITDRHGATWEEKFSNAQQQLGPQGGVVYFPAGTYMFQEDIVLKHGVVIRGERPAGTAKDKTYAPPTVFEFPKYKPGLKGEGTPTATAFKTIRLHNPAQDSRCGIVNVSIRFGAIHFPEGKNHQCGKNRVVFGCRLEAAARAIPSIPTAWQHPWQRYTHRHRAAIQIYTAKNALVANNRLPDSQKHNFTMPGYKIKNRQGDIMEHDRVVFDYDNRPGIVVNGFAIGAGGGNPPDGTPESHPFGFREGLHIRDNFIFSTGGYGILFTGDGTVCADNTIRFPPDVYRATVTGEKLSSGSSTNGNRAVEMRGWRYTVTGNDYKVYSNIAADGKYRINDGEGLMHEDHVNSIVKDSKILHNRGNAYISIYKTGGINGLVVKGNTIASNIFVVANRNSGPYPCRNVSIEDNITPKIIIEGDPASKNRVIDNQNPLQAQGVIRNQANATLKRNQGYREE